MTITIADNDNPVSLSVSGNGAIGEGDAALTITATLETANATGAALAIPVRVRKAGTTATAGDYTLAETISIPDGASSGTTAFAVVDDDEGEPRETVVVELGSPLPAGIAVGATALVTIAIADNDARTVELTEPEVALTTAVTVALAAERASVAEDNGEVKFTVTMSRALEAGETAVVPLTVTGGKPNRHWNIRFRPKDNEPGVKRTAAGRDSVVTFTEGGRVATLVLIARPNHDTVERTIRIAFGTGERAPVATGVAGGIAPAGGALAVAIVDDDAAAGPALWAKDERARENAGAMRFAVRLTMPAAEVVQVRARTRDARPVSARANRDYEPVRVDLSFRPGETEKHVRVRIFNDAHDEGRETFELVLSNAEGAVIADRVAVGTIENDDPLPAAQQQQQQVADPEVTIAAGAGITEGGSATFVLTADPVPAAPLDVTVTVATDGAFGITAGERTVTIPTTGSYTLTLATDDDGSDEPNGSVTATVAAGTGYTVGTPSSGSVAIADDDVPEIEIAAGADVTEGTAASFVLTATPPPATALEVTVTVAASGDYGITAGERTVTIPTTGSTTLTLATDDDGSDEPNGSVTATVAAGTGYTVGTPSSGSVAIADDDVPEIEIAAGAGVTEGTAASFVLTATPPPAAALEVTVTVAASGDYGITAGQRTVTIPTTGTYTLTLATDNDGTDEPNGSVSATLNAGTGYTVGTASTGTVAIADDDLPPPAVSVAAGSGVVEGGDAVFTVTADRAVDANLAVALTVSEATGSDFVAAADEGAKTVTILAGKTSAALTVRTEDDMVDEPDGSVTATLAAGSGYTVASSPKDAASVAVADNDAAGGALPVLSVESKSVQEGDGKVTLWATIDPFPSKADFPELYRTTRLKLRTIEGTAWDGVDYVGIPAYFGITEACNFHTTLVPNGKHGCRIDEVTILDDPHDDGGETFQLEVGFADREPARLRRLGAARGTITIENSDPLPAAYLARFGRTVAEQALDGIAGRMSASRTPGMQGTVAGQALSFDPSAAGQPAANGATPGSSGASGTVPADRNAALAMAGIARGLGADASAPASPASAADPFGAGLSDSRFGTPSLQSRSMTARDALLGSSFSLTGQKDGAGGSLAFWGRASQASFDGAERGDGTDIGLDGTVTTGMLGADYARGKWLVGLALTQSSSEGSYAAIGGDPCPDTDGDLCDGAVRAGDGDVEASLKVAIPYAALQVSERLKLWGAAGHGTGEVTLKTMEESYSADTSWTMAATGLRGDLLAPPEDGGSGSALALTSDALWARTSSDKTGDLAATDSDATRLRLGLEGSYRMALEGDGHLTPKLEIGARHDGGDAETGFGVEFGGGLAWSAPGLGLSLDVSGRTLLAHEDDDLKDRGVSAALAFDSDPATQRGPSFSLRQALGGQAQGGLDALFAPDPLEDRSGSEATSRWTMEAAWGVPAFGGRFTGSPHVGLGLATDARDYSLGWRLTPEAASAPDLSFGLKATRRESDTAAPEHTVGVEATMRW